MFQHVILLYNLGTTNKNVSTIYIIKLIWSSKCSFQCNKYQLIQRYQIYNFVLFLGLYWKVIASYITFSLAPFHFLLIYYHHKNIYPPEKKIEKQSFTYFRLNTPSLSPIAAMSRIAIVLMIFLLMLPVALSGLRWVESNICKCIGVCVCVCTKMKALAGNVRTYIQIAKEWSRSRWRNIHD